MPRFTQFTLVAEVPYPEAMRALENMPDEQLTGQLAEGHFAAPLNDPLMWDPQEPEHETLHRLVRDVLRGDLNTLYMGAAHPECDGMLARGAIRGYPTLSFLMALDDAWSESRMANPVVRLLALNVTGRPAPRPTWNVDELDVDELDADEPDDEDPSDASSDDPLHLARLQAAVRQRYDTITANRVYYGGAPTTSGGGTWSYGTTTTTTQF